MDFYNFEKYNDLFCFEKLNGDYQPLLKTYKDSYHTSMNTFLKEYEENTELRFIESQLYFCNKEIIIQKSIIISLEELDHETFYYVRNRIGERHCVYTKNIGDPFENETQIIFENSKNDVTDEFKSPTIINFTNDDDNDEVLDMYATSKNFIKFISNRITSLCLINEFLVQRKQELEKESNLKFSSHENDKKTDLILEDIALKLAWEDVNVTRENAIDFLIGTKYKSGEKLYNHFILYRNSTDRRSDPQSKVKLKHKIRRFEKVIEVLDDKFKPQAEDELKKIKTYLLKY